MELNGLAWCLHAVVLALCFAEPLFVLAMLRAQASARLRTTPRGAALEAWDGIPTALSVCGAPAVIAIVMASRGLHGASTTTLAGLVAVVLALCASFRVRLEAGPAAALLVRTVLWVVPWRRVHLDQPSAWTDGWGDVADPLALWVGDEAHAVEIGWCGAGDGERADRLVHLFSIAAKLRPE